MLPSRFLDWGVGHFPDQRPHPIHMFPQLDDLRADPLVAHLDGQRIVKLIAEISTQSSISLR